jgi:hypothetical protein
MHFAFQGFEQHEGSRKLKFLCVKDNRPAGTLALSVNIRLLVDAGISLQEAPALCVQVLKAAAETTETVETYQDYALTAQDLAAFTAPRKAQAAEREKRKGSRPSRPRTAPFQPFGQPINLSARPL